MIYPNKNIRFKESVINKMTSILILKRFEEMQIEILYEKVKDEFESIDQFLIALDVLYALDSIVLDETKGKIKYVN